MEEADKDWMMDDDQDGGWVNVSSVGCV